MPGVVHVLDPYHGIARGWDSAEESLAMLEEVIQLEGPQTIAAFILETVTGTNGVLVPPDGYIQGVRELCTRHGILMICDEVMAGFGRTGEWFAVDHWNVVPDMITMAKGLTAAYVPLGAVGMRRTIADQFKDKVFYGGLTYNSHPLACAAALAAIKVYEDDKLIENARAMGAIMAELMVGLARRHPSVGAARSRNASQSTRKSSRTAVSRSFSGTPRRALSRPMDGPMPARRTSGSRAAKAGGTTSSQNCTKPR